MGAGTYQIQDGHFHHALVEIGSPILDNLDGDDFLRLEVLTFHDLAESALAQHVENEISVPGNMRVRTISSKKRRRMEDELVTSFLRSENIIHIEDIVAVFVIEAVVLGALAGLGQDTARVSGGLVFEIRVAYSVGSGEMDGERLQRLRESSCQQKDASHNKTGRGVLTLMKPPSGFALRNAGCALTLGCRSLTLRSLVNSGTVGTTWRRGGDFTSLKLPSMLIGEKGSRPAP